MCSFLRSRRITDISQPRDSQRAGIVENVKAPVTAVSACVRLFVELLLEGPSRVDANDVAAGRPGEATQRKPFGEELM